MDILHETAVPAAPDAVIETLTTEEGLAAFWTDQVRAVPEEGSEAWFGFGPNAEHQFRFTVAHIGTDRVAWRCVGGPPAWVGTEVGWLLSPAEDGTRVRLEHRGWSSADGELASCSFVWTQVLHRLADYLRAGTPQPYFRQSA